MKKFLNFIKKYHIVIGWVVLGLLFLLARDLDYTPKPRSQEEIQRDIDMQNDNDVPRLPD